MNYRVIVVLASASLAQAWNPFSYFKTDKATDTGASETGSTTGSRTGYSDAEPYEQTDMRGGSCKGYVCDWRVGPCVDDPLKCPCRDGKQKCMIGKDHFVCLAKNESCKRLQKQL